MNVKFCFILLPMLNNLDTEPVPFSSRCLVHQNMFLGRLKIRIEFRKTPKFRKDFNSAFMK